MIWPGSNCFLSFYVFLHLFSLSLSLFVLPLNSTRSASLTSPHILRECFTQAHHPSLAPSTAETCAFLLETLRGGPHFDEPQHWRRGVTKAFISPLAREHCRITLTPEKIGGTTGSTPLMMSTKEIAIWAEGLLRSCRGKPPDFGFGGVVWLNRFDVKAQLVIASPKNG